MWVHVPKKITNYYYYIIIVKGNVKMYVERIFLFQKVNMNPKVTKYQESDGLALILFIMYN